MTAYFVVIVDIVICSYWMDNGVAYLCITDRLFPKRLAFNYLDEVSLAFHQLYGSQVEGAQRPYAFIQFGKRQIAF